MNLQEVPLKSEYRSRVDDMVKDFYLPLLKNAVSYQRAVGFFSSSALVEISKGIATMAGQGGKIQIVASPYLSNEDIEAIRFGYEERNRVIENALLRQLQSDMVDHFSMERLNLLASLIADGIMDIRIAYVEDKHGIGMYHEKMGLIEDVTGNIVAFSGSMNESATAMAINYEAIDVFRSWGDRNEAERVERKRKAFQAIWNDCEPNVHVISFPHVTETLIKRYRRSKPNFLIDEEQFPGFHSIATKDEPIEEVAPISKEPAEEITIGARIPKKFSLYDYQKKAISVWASKGYRGIFDMATGTGKTLTGLGAVSKLSEALNDRLAVIIVCPYQHLVEQWVEDIREFNISPIIGYSSSSQKDWKNRLANAILDQRIREDKRFFCFVCTNDTFKSKYVQEQINKINSPILIVADEAHNFGAQSYAQVLDDRFAYRLALSATVDRHGDEEGTARLYQFFGSKCIEYSLEQAIKEEKLTPYKYHPVVVHLMPDELEKYRNISLEMSDCVIKGRNGKMKLNKYGEILALKRARIIAGASEKLDALREQIRPYIHENNILVYCGATHVNYEGKYDEENVRQIEAVTRILGKELGMRVSKFTAEENMETRASIKEHFQKGQDLQAIVAIKCLDEGVNIPGIRTAFILASTTNPKEYIQRRGRVLRRAPNKEFAEIYDFVTLPRPLEEVSSLTKEQMQRDLRLVKNELARIKEFGRVSMDPTEAYELIWNIQEAYQIAEEEEDDDGYGY